VKLLDEAGKFDPAKLLRHGVFDAVPFPPPNESVQIPDMVVIHQVGPTPVPHPTHAQVTHRPRMDWPAPSSS